MSTPKPKKNTTVLNKKGRDFIMKYFEIGSAIKAYAEIFNKEISKISNQPYEILRSSEGAAYLKELKLRDYDKAIMTRDELAEVISTQALDGCKKSQALLAKILGSFELDNNQQQEMRQPTTVTIVLDKGPEDTTDEPVERKKAEDG